MNAICFYVQYEKLHRYVFNYHYQSTNEDFGRPSNWVKANRNNKTPFLNPVACLLLKILSPFFKGWRGRLKEHFEGRYKRYERI